MSTTQIDGGKQIRSGTVTDTQIASGAAIADAKLAVPYLKADGTRALTGDQSAGGFKVTNLGTPTASGDAATKGYVDSAVQGFDWKQSVRAATTANGTLSSAYANSSVVDGVTLVTGDRILLKNQTTASENGIYTVNASGAPTRATDADTSAEVTAGLTTFVSEGTTNGNTSWNLTTDDPITLGTTGLVFAQVSGGTGGSVTTVSVTSANGFAGSVSNASSTPAITVSTTVTGILKGNGTAVSAATSGTDYAPATSGSGILKGNGSGGFSAASAGTDYLAPSNVVTRETPTGSVNGSNTSFTLANTPLSGSEEVYLNGILQEPGAGNDYTISGGTITYLTAPATVTACASLTGSDDRLMARTEVTGAQIKDASVSLTADVTGTLPVANGGTGGTGQTLNNVLLGNGTGAFQNVAPSTAGNVLRSDGSTWASAASVRVASITTSATPSINVATTDHYDITALAADATISTTGSASNWQPLWVTITPTATRALVWNSSNFANSGVASWPTSAPSGKTITAAGKYNPTLAKFVCMAVDLTGY